MGHVWLDGVLNVEGHIRHGSGFTALSEAQKAALIRTNCYQQPCNRPLLSPLNAEGRPFLDVAIKDRLSVHVHLKRGITSQPDAAELAGRPAAHACLVRMFTYTYEVGLVPCFLYAGALVHRVSKSMRGKSGLDFVDLEEDQQMIAQVRGFTTDEIRRSPEEHPPQQLQRGPTRRHATSSPRHPARAAAGFRHLDGVGWKGSGGARASDH